ncbi:MAG: PAS domain S-box protein [Gemmatimonadetes bacterium]|nr:PAS domain S-box protein [Gemmatimonadota bacterium]
MTPEFARSRRLHVMLAATVLTLGATVAILGWRYGAHADADAWRDRAGAIVDESGRAALALARVDDAARTALALGDARSRARLDAATADLDGSLGRLDTLVRFVSAQHARVAVAMRASAAHEELVERLVADRVAGRVAPSRAIETLDSAAAALPARAALGLVAREQAAARDRHARREDAQRRATTWVVVAILLLAGVVVLWAARTVERQVTRLAQGEQRLASMMEAMEEGVVLQDANAVIHVWNPSAERILGLTGEQIAGRSSFDPRWRVIDEDGQPLPGDRHMVPVALRTGRRCTGVMGVERPDGTRVWIKVHAVPLRSLDGRAPTTAVCTFADVTAERLATHALAESEARYRVIAETSAEGIVRVDAELRITYANGRLATMLGRQPDELVGHDVRDFVHPDDHALLLANFARRREGQTGRYDLRCRHADGSDVWVSNSSAPLFDAAGQFLGGLGMLTDISARRVLEAEVRQAHKMDAMGRMASAVAHDFNNLLTVIRSVANLRRDAGPTGDRWVEDMNEILGAVDRGASLTAHLLAFCRALPAEPRELPVAPLLRDFRTTLARLVPSFVRIDVRLDADDAQLRILADPLQVERALLNLAGNAADAMPFGGDLVVRAFVTETEAPIASRYGAIAPGTYVCLAVADTGAGMTEAVLSHLFEPFFSTKPQGRGTGLGLATVYGIVQQAGGGVTVRSSPGEGTTVTLFFPSATAVGRGAAEAASGGGPAGASPATAPAVAGAVLVVDDEPAVRSIVARVLAARGYEVLVAGSGAEALELMLARGSRVRALITDVKMPGMTGVELARALAAQGIELPVLFLSGQLDAPVPLKHGGRHPQQFLGKPFRNHDLMHALERLLHVA